MIISRRFALLYLHSPDHVEVWQVLVGVRRRAQAQQLMDGDRVRVARAHVPCGDVYAESGGNLWVIALRDLLRLLQVLQVVVLGRSAPLVALVLRPFHPEQSDRANPIALNATPA